MDAIDAAILGFVEGVTEFLPVSSTGHLIVAQRALGIPESEAADSYAIAIQAGAILAVLVLFGVWPVVFAWTVGAFAILALGDRLRPPGGRTVTEIDLRMALAIGLF